MSRVGHIRGIGLMLIGAFLTVSCTSEPAATSTTAVTAGSSTTTTSSTTAPTTVSETTTTVSEEQRIAEVTEIVQQVEFGWFDAIYRKDERALADWVARQESVEQAAKLMQNGDFFVAQPTLSGLNIEIIQILEDREDCLAVAFHGDATSFRGSDAVGEVTAVFWPRSRNGNWRRAYQGDEWRAACDQFSRDGQIP